MLNILSMSRSPILDFQPSLPPIKVLQFWCQLLEELNSVAVTAVADGFWVSTYPSRHPSTPLNQTPPISPHWPRRPPTPTLRQSLPPGSERPWIRPVLCHHMAIQCHTNRQTIWECHQRAKSITHSSTQIMLPDKYKDHDGSHNYVQVHWNIK